MVTTLILKTTRSQYGSPFDAENDYIVLDGDHVIGRIFPSPQSPPDRNWMWTITAVDFKPSIHNRGYSATREEAMTDFKGQWLGCLSGHSLTRLDREVLKYLLLQTAGVAVANHFRRSSPLAR